MLMEVVSCVNVDSVLSGETQQNNTKTDEARQQSRQQSRETAGWMERDI